MVGELQSLQNQTQRVRELQPLLNQTQRVRLQAAIQQLQDLSSQSPTAIVGDAIPVDLEDRILKGHGTLELGGQVVATHCGVVERVDKLLLVRPLRSRYKAEVGDIIVGRVVEIAPKRWKLEINCSRYAILMLSSMNLPDGIQRRRTAVDELNMRSIFEENDVVCAEVHVCHQGESVLLHARSRKYGKLERGQLLTVPTYLVKRHKQHFHHLEQYGVDLILGVNGFIWVGEHVQTGEKATLEKQAKTQDGSGKSTATAMVIYEQQQMFTPLDVRRHSCRIANAVRVLSALGFSLSIETIIETVDASIALNINIKDMLGADFYVQIAEMEVQRRVTLLKKKGRYEF